jgi:protein-S-isoprenylcysteine O-methyltransferase Ste14
VTPSQRLVAVQFILFAALGLAAVVTQPQAAEASQVIGIGLIGLGLVVIVVALITFRDIAKTTPNISPAPKRKGTLVTAGIYGRMRHPIYSGVLLIAFGAALAHGNMVMWVVVAAMYIFFYAKSRYEEALLLSVYPEYRDYMMRTGRFLPRL